MRLPSRDSIRGPISSPLWNAKTPVSHTDRMKQRIDTPEGRALYGRRFAIVEPVFANIRHNKRLDRFTLRGCVKVNA